MALLMGATNLIFQLPQWYNGLDTGSWSEYLWVQIQPAAWGSHLFPFVHFDHRQ